MTTNDKRGPSPAVAGKAGDSTFEQEFAEFMSTAEYPVPLSAEDLRKMNGLIEDVKRDLNRKAANAAPEPERAAGSNPSSNT